MNNPGTAAAETGAHLATMGVALPVAGLAGLATEAAHAVGLTDKRGADVVHAVGDVLTYTPRGELGQAATDLVTKPFQWLAEKGQQAGTAKDRPVSINLPQITDVATCNQAQAQITASVASGDLLPSEGEALAGLVEHQRRALESHDLARRLEAIEQQLLKGKS